MKITTQEIGS